MKKLISIFAIIGAAFCANADDYTDLLDSYETYTNFRDADKSAELYVSYLEQTQPKIFLTVATAYRNTFIWYVWKGYAKANNFGKLNALQVINQINQ